MIDWCTLDSEVFIITKEMDEVHYHFRSMSSHIRSGIRWVVITWVKRGGGALNFGSDVDDQKVTWN